MFLTTTSIPKSKTNWKKIENYLIQIFKLNQFQNFKPKMNQFVSKLINFKIYNLQLYVRKILKSRNLEKNLIREIQN